MDDHRMNPDAVERLYQRVRRQNDELQAKGELPMLPFGPMSPQGWEEWKAHPARQPALADRPTRTLRSKGMIPPIVTPGDLAPQTFELPKAVGYCFEPPAYLTGTSFEEAANLALTRRLVRAVECLHPSETPIPNRESWKYVNFEQERVICDLARFTAGLYSTASKWKPTVDEEHQLRSLFGAWMKCHVEYYEGASFWDLNYRQLKLTAVAAVTSCACRVGLRLGPGDLQTCVTIETPANDPDVDEKIKVAHDKLLAVASGERIGLRIPLADKGATDWYVPAAVLMLDVSDFSDEPQMVLVDTSSIDEAERVEAFLWTRWLPAINRLGAYGKWTALRLEGPPEHQATALRLYLEALTDEPPYIVRRRRAQGIEYSDGENRWRLCHQD